MRRHRWLAMETARKAGASWAEIAAAAGMEAPAARRLYEQTLAGQKAFGYASRTESIPAARSCRRCRQPPPDSRPRRPAAHRPRTTSLTMPAPSPPKTVTLSLPPCPGFPHPRLPLSRPIPSRSSSRFVSHRPSSIRPRQTPLPGEGDGGRGRDHDRDIGQPGGHIRDHPDDHPRAALSGHAPVPSRWVVWDARPGVLTPRRSQLRRPPPRPTNEQVRAGARTLAICLCGAPCTLHRGSQSVGAGSAPAHRTRCLLVPGRYDDLWITMSPEAIGSVFAWLSAPLPPATLS